MKPECKESGQKLMRIRNTNSDYSMSNRWSPEKEQYEMKRRPGQLNKAKATFKRPPFYIIQKEEGVKRLGRRAKQQSN